MGKKAGINLSLIQMIKGNQSRQSMNKILHVDFETYSELDVRNVGAHAYGRHPSTEVLMMGWAFDDQSIELWVPDASWHYDTIPPVVLRHAQQGGMMAAHNVEFEINIFRYVLGINTEFEQWVDTAVLGLINGYPKSLAGLAAALEMPEQKDNRGKVLIRRFCQPRKPTKNNPLTRNWPCQFPAEWAEFEQYCIQDVNVEREIWHKLHG